MKMFGMCINWKVIGGLAAVGALLFVFVSPATAAAALPFLLILICPLSMLLMMKSMSGMHSKTGAQNVNASNATTEQRACCTPSKALSKEEQMAQLHTQLRDLQAQQERLSAHLTQLETLTPANASSPAVKPSN